MQIKIRKNDLLEGLFIAQSIADKKGTNPYVANILLRTDGQSSIICAATDLRISVSAKLAVDVIQEGGLSIGAKYLYEIAKNLSAEEIKITRLENNWAEIQAGKAKYKVAGISHLDFPKIPDPREVKFHEVDSVIFSEMLRKTSFSVSLDEMRHHLNGIYMESDGKTCTMVSTDGHRLSKIEREFGQTFKLDKGIIVPRKGVMEIRRLIDAKSGTCEIGIHQNTFFVTARSTTLAVSLIDAQFPPYKQVIPQESEKIIAVDRNQFLEALKRISILSSERSWGIRLELKKNTLRLTTDNPELGEAEEELPIEYSGKDLFIGFNARYFIDALGEMDTPQISLELNGELDPAVVRPAGTRDYLGVVMPMRI